MLKAIQMTFQAFGSCVCAFFSFNFVNGIVATDDAVEKNWKSLVMWAEYITRLLNLLIQKSYFIRRNSFRLHCQTLRSKGPINYG